MKRTILSLAAAAALFSALPAFSAEAEVATSLELLGAYYPPNLGGYGISGFAPVDFSQVPGNLLLGERDLGSGWGGAEAKAVLSRSWTIPALRGEGAFTSGNSLELKAQAEFSPVSLNAAFSATLTPVAFLKLTGGAAVGTGWNVGFLGLCLNPPSDTQDYVQQSFGGAVWRAWGSGTFQFDLAALLPGDWNHVVLVASPSVEYKAYTGAASGQAWLWEADQGMNFNGAKLKATYFLGYQMPLVLDTVGFLLETEEWIGEVRDYSFMASTGGWGSDFVALNFGPLLNFRLGDKASLAVLVQFKTARKWTDLTTRKRYFGNRDYEGSYLYFNRVALNCSLEL